MRIDQGVYLWASNGLLSVQIYVCEKRTCTAKQNQIESEGLIDRRLAASETVGTNRYLPLSGGSS